MKIILLSVLGCLFITFVSAVNPAWSDEVVRANMDRIESLATRIEIDTKRKVEGNGSVRITTAWPTMIPLHDASGLSLENTKLVYKAKVRSEDLMGSAYLEMWVRVKGQAYFSRGMQSTVEGTTKEWQTITTDFFLKPEQQADQVLLNIIINGRGTVWVDDVTLDSEPLPDLPQ